MNQFYQTLTINRSECLYRTEIRIEIRTEIPEIYDYNQRGTYTPYVLGYCK